MDGSDVSGARALIEIGSINATSTTVTAAFQVADHTDEVDGAVANIGDGQNTKAVHYPGTYEDLKTDTQGDQLIRFGFNIKSSTGPGWARVRAKIDLIDR